MPGMLGPSGSLSEVVDRRAKVEVTVEVTVAVPLHCCTTATAKPRTGSWGFVELAKYARYLLRTRTCSDWESPSHPPT